MESGVYFGVYGFFGAAPVLHNPKMLYWSRSAGVYLLELELDSLIAVEVLL